MSAYHAAWHTCFTTWSSSSGRCVCANHLRQYENSCKVHSLRLCRLRKFRVIFTLLVNLRMHSDKILPCERTALHVRRAGRICDRVKACAIIYTGRMLAPYIDCQCSKWITALMRGGLQPDLHRVSTMKSHHAATFIFLQLFICFTRLRNITLAP